MYSHPSGVRLRSAQAPYTQRQLSHSHNRLPTVWPLRGWGCGKEQLYTEFWRSTEEQPLSRASMKRVAPTALNVVMHGLRSQPQGLVSRRCTDLEPLFRVSYRSIWHRMYFAILTWGCFSRHVFDYIVTYTLHLARRLGRLNQL